MNSLKIRKIEVMVVFVCLFIGLFCIYAAGFRSREHAKQIVCTSNIRLNCQSIIDYAADHDGSVTLAGSGFWPCDFTYAATDNLMQYGSTRQSFYCPSNKGASAYDRRFWQFIQNFYCGCAPAPYPDFTEPDDLSTRQSYYRIVTYVFLIEHNEGVIPPMQGSPPRDWISDLDDIVNPQEYEMIVDQIISESVSDKFYNLTSGMGSNFNIAEQSNHLNKSGYPFGCNIGYVDGHVAWKPFEQTQIRLYIAGVRYYWW